MAVHITQTGKFSGLYTYAEVVRGIPKSVAIPVVGSDVLLRLYERAIRDLNDTADLFERIVNLAGVRAHPSIVALIEAGHRAYVVMECQTSDLLITFDDILMMIDMIRPPINDFYTYLRSDNFIRSDIVMIHPDLVGIWFFFSNIKGNLSLVADYLHLFKVGP